MFVTREVVGPFSTCHGLLFPCSQHRQTFVAQQIQLMSKARDIWVHSFLQYSLDTSPSNIETIKQPLAQMG